MACGVRLGCAAAATPGHARQRRSAECGFCQSRRNGRAAEAHAEAFEASVWQRGALTPCRAPRAADRLWPVAVRKVDQHRAAEPAGQGAAGPGGDAGGARAHHRLPAQGPAQAPEVSARAEPPPLWAAPVCARLVPCVAPGRGLQRRAVMALLGGTVPSGSYLSYCPVDVTVGAGRNAGALRGACAAAMPAAVCMRGQRRAPQPHCPVVAVPAGLGLSLLERRCGCCDRLLGGWPLAAQSDHWCRQ